MKDIVIACVDIGSPQQGNVGYSIWLNGTQHFPVQNTPCPVNDRAIAFVDCLANLIRQNYRIALGFECPLFVPRRDNFDKLSKQRVGETGIAVAVKYSKSWSASAGVCSLGIGIPIADWILKKLKAKNELIIATVDWNAFQLNEPKPNLFLWEAFSIPSAENRENGESSHDADARLAVKEFMKLIEDPPRGVETIVPPEGEDCISLIGLSILRNGMGGLNSANVLEMHGLVLKVPKAI